MNPYIFFFLIYFGGISLVTAVITALDKYKAKKGKWRIPEATLFILAFLGGSVSEYTVMRLIRHKTKHKRFMLGLPVIILLQLILVFFILSQING